MLSLSHSKDTDVVFHNFNELFTNESSHAVIAEEPVNNYNFSCVKLLSGFAVMFL